VSFCIFLSHSRYFSSLFSFQFILQLLEFFFWNVFGMHIFAMLKFFGLNCDILCLYFYKSLFYYCYSANFFFSTLTRIFFYGLCLAKFLLVLLQNHVCYQLPA
jgi:hypothetical protein